MMFKFGNWLFLAAFLTSAAVQYNDPDAFWWSTVYLAAAALCLDQLLRRQFGWLALPLLLISLCWSLWLLPSIVGQVSWQDVTASIQMKTEAVEEAREIGGLLLVSLWSGVVLRHLSRNRITPER